MGAFRLTRRRRAVSANVALAALCGFAALAISMSDRGDAAYPGGNGRIAYASGDSYSYSSAGIWSANADGGSPTLLTVGPGDTAPSYSADGARIAFDRENGIAVMSENGSGLTQLLTGGNAQSNQTTWKQNYVDPHSDKTIPIVRIQSFVYEWQTFDHPSFSPDGSQLALTEASGRRISRSICAVEELNEQTCLGFGNPDVYFNYEYSCDACGSHLISINSQTGARIEALTALVGGRRDTKPGVLGGRQDRLLTCRPGRFVDLRHRRPGGRAAPGHERPVRSSARLLAGQLADRLQPRI